MDGLGGISTVKNDGCVNGKYGGQRILEWDEDMYRTRRKMRGIGDAMKRRSVIDDLNREPDITECGYITKKRCECTKKWFQV